MTDKAHTETNDPVANLRFRLGIERAGVGIWDLDFLTQEVTWSENAAKLFGESRRLAYEAFLALLDRPSRAESRVGFPEKLFARINQVLPGLVDGSMRKQLPVIRRFAGK